MIILGRKLAGGKFDLKFVLAGTAIALSSSIVAARADWGCVKDVSTHGCARNPSGWHILQFHNGCSTVQEVLVKFRWYKNPKLCEQGGTGLIAPGETGSITVGLCSQGAFNWNWRAGGEIPRCPILP
jgi:hypothetical protein